MLNITHTLPNTLKRSRWQYFGEHLNMYVNYSNFVMDCNRKDVSSIGIFSTHSSIKYALITQLIERVVTSDSISDLEPSRHKTTSSTAKKPGH